jgi:hypothetical protein
MVLEIIEEFVWFFIKVVAQKIGVAIRFILFGRKLTFEQIIESKWNLRVGLVVLFISVALLIAIVV